MTQTKQFYDRLQFPGPYTEKQLSIHYEEVKNPYLNIIDQNIPESGNILDVGCGTGLVSNLMAIRHPTCQFTGVDFADSIDHAKQFAKNNNIKNVQFIKKDFLAYTTKTQYDAVICQGVLHHIPNYLQASENIDLLLKPGGRLILGLYHPWGKILKKFVNINYGSDILYKDQELNPYETSFNLEQAKRLFPGYTLSSAYPGTINTLIPLQAFFNYRNGGLVTYILEKSE